MLLVNYQSGVYHIQERGNWPTADPEERESCQVLMLRVTVTPSCAICVDFLGRVVSFALAQSARGDYNRDARMCFLGLPGSGDLIPSSFATSDDIQEGRIWP